MLSIRHFSQCLAFGSALCSLAGQATVQDLLAYYENEANNLYLPIMGGILPEKKKLSELLFSNDIDEREAGATLLYHSYKKIVDTADKCAGSDDAKFFKLFNKFTCCHFFSACAHFLRSCRDLTASEELMGDEIRSMFNVDKVLVLDLSSLVQATGSNFSDDAKLLAQLGLSYLSDAQSLTNEQKQQLQDTWKTYTDQWMDEISSEGTREIVAANIIEPYQKYFSGQHVDSPIIPTPSFFANVLAFFECRHESPDGVRLYHYMEHEDSEKQSKTHGKVDDLLESIKSSRGGGPKISYSNSSTTDPITHSVALRERPSKKQSQRSTKTKAQTQEQVFQYSNWFFNNCAGSMTEQDDLSHEFGHIFQRSISVPNDRLAGTPNILSLNHVVPALFTLRGDALVYSSYGNPQMDARESNFQNYNSLFTDREPTQQIRPRQLLFNGASEVSNMFGGSVLPGRPVTKKINSQETTVREKVLVVFPHCELMQRKEANLPFRKSHSLFSDPRQQKLVNEGITPNKENISKFINFINEVKKSELELLKNSQ